MNGIILPHSHSLAPLTISTSQTIAQSFPINPFNWVGLAVLGSLLVIAAAAVIYMLAPILESRGIKEWAVFQIYEAILSIALIFLFLGILSMFFINPQTSFQKAGIVPQACTASTVNTIFTMASCNMAQFNNAAFNFVYDVYAISALQAISPSYNATITLNPNPPPNLTIEFAVPNIFTAISGEYFSEGFGIANIFSTLNSGMFLILNQVFDGFIVLSQLQLIVVSGSLLFFAFFMTLGLIARVFGFSRSFGGSMIALGLGIGLVYPMMVAISYGFIDAQPVQQCLASAGCAYGGAVALAGGSLIAGAAPTAGILAIKSLYGIMPAIGVGALGLGAITGTAALAAVNAQSIGSALSTLFNIIGYLLAGLTVVPVINLLVVDIFVMDFSQAFGEKISFQEMFSRLI